MSVKGDYLRLYTSVDRPFSGFSKDFEKADYVVLGFPFDRTSTYRAGSALAPSAIREASNNIETYSLRSNIDVEDIAICDVGNLDVVDNVEETLKRLKQVLKDIHQTGKMPFVIGGEHTLTYAAVRALGNDVAIVDFDAHLDLRDEYMGEKMSHTTFMRRLAEEIGPEKIIEVGTRAVSKDELKYAKETGITFLTSHDIRKKGSAEISEKINSKLDEYENKYVTIDIDVLDPAYAPGVGNPEAEGIENFTLIDILGRIIDEKLVGFDLVEVCPNYDNGVTSALASKIIFEVLAYIQKHHK
jgi:agmatinase